MSRTTRLIVSAIPSVLWIAGMILLMQPPPRKIYTCTPYESLRYPVGLCEVEKERESKIREAARLYDEAIIR